MIIKKYLCPRVCAPVHVETEKHFRISSAEIRGGTKKFRIASLSREEFSCENAAERRLEKTNNFNELPRVASLPEYRKLDRYASKKDPNFFREIRKLGLREPLKVTITTEHTN